MRTYLRAMIFFLFIISAISLLFARNIDQRLPQLRVNDVENTEGNSGTKAFVFTVTLSAPSNGVVTVVCGVTSGTATIPDGDFQSFLGTLTFNPGETSKTFSVLVNGDTRFETDEWFNVTLSKAVNATIADYAGVGTIKNDDGK